MKQEVSWLIIFLFLTLLVHVLNIILGQKAIFYSLLKLLAKFYNLVKYSKEIFKFREKRQIFFDLANCYTNSKISRETQKFWNSNIARKKLL